METADNDVMARMRAANPVSAADLRMAIDEGDLRDAMEAAISAGESPTQPVPAGDSVANAAGIARGDRRSLPVGRRGATLAAGLACAVLVALGILLAGAPGGGGQPAFAAAAIKVAEANPRLLVTEPGWKVIDAGDFEADEGEMTFSDGGHRLSINWYPARLYSSYRRDRASVSTPEASVLLGQTATTVHYGGAEYATMLSPQGTVFLEVRGGLDNRAEYEAVLHSLRRVDVDTWLGAMPPNVVRPQDRAGVVERMLGDVPLPPGFDLAALQGADAVLNHYQLAAKVAGEVSCGWVESWLAATEAGDGARAQQAVEAMATSRHWPMMPTLIKGGGWSGNVWRAAREIETGHLDRGAAGEVVNPDGTGYELGPAWATELNCRSRYWRRPLDPNP